MVRKLRTLPECRVKACPVLRAGARQNRKKPVPWLPPSVDVSSMKVQMIWALAKHQQRKRGPVRAPFDIRIRTSQQE
jgi:hypothetical protein